MHSRPERTCIRSSRRRRSASPSATSSRRCAADIIKIAMLRVHRALRKAGFRSRLLLQVHDELVLEVAPGEAAQIEELVRREMGSAYLLDVSLDVSVGLGHSWADAAH